MPIEISRENAIALEKALQEHFKKGSFISNKVIIVDDPKQLGPIEWFKMAVTTVMYRLGWVRRHRHTDLVKDHLKECRGRMKAEHELASLRRKHAFDVESSGYGIAALEHQVSTLKDQLAGK